MSCPYCLQTTPGTSSAFTREKDIDAEIEHVEDLISRLSTERSRLCKKRNEMRSPIYSLPPENLALIFKFACPPLDFSHKYGVDVVAPSIFHPRVGAIEKVVYPRITGVLSAVSTLWHSTVSSTPSLWTSFVADDEDLRLIRMVLARSGNLPISASITADTTPSSYQSFVVEPILQEAARIRMLHVRNTSNTWLKEHISRFINLELLCLQGGMNRDDLDLVGSSCTRLVLKRFTCRITLSWSKIQVLHLTHMPVDVCLEMLEKCTNLIEFRLKCPTTSRVEGVQFPTSPFTLPRLKVFEWLVDVENPVDCLMLRYTHMPVLNTLIWSEPQTDLIPSDTLSTFFERLPPTLAAVQIQYCVVHSDFTIFSYFLDLPHVEDLVFGKCAGSFMNVVFDNLGSVAENQLPVLPKLKSVYIDRFTGHLDQEKVLETFRRRGTLLENPFRLEFMKSRVEWTLEFQNELIKMVEAGYKIELWEDSEPVDWLSSS